MALTKKYKLPKVPPQLASMFRKLCEVMPVEDLPRIRVELEDAIQKMNDLPSANPKVDRQAVIDLSERSRYLLDRYETFTPAQQSLAIGAIRYFILIDDAFSDEVFAAGMDDDVAVMNYVLQELDIEDQFIYTGQR